MKRDKSHEQFLLLTFRSFLADSPDMIFMKDTSLHYVAASRSFANALGHTDPKELEGMTDFELVYPELATQYVEDDRRVLATGLPIIDRIEPLPDQNGRKSYSSTSKYVIRDEDGTVIGLYGFGRDVTAQMELQEERENRTLSRQIYLGVLDSDLTENRVLRTEGFAWLQVPGAAIDKTFAEAMTYLATHHIHAGYSDEFLAFHQMQRLIDSYEVGIREFQIITSLSTDGIEYRWVEFKSRLYASRFTNTLRITTVLNDMDKEIKDKERLKHRAETDPLTGLLNRESVMRRIQDCIGGYGAGQSHTLLFVDLDHFKQVNDTLGHPFGDMVLKSIADHLTLGFRKYDIVGRVGGDEFLVLLKNVSSQEEAEIRTKEVFDTFSLYQPAAEGGIHVSCSVGAAMYNGDGKPLEILYAEADKAMYRAKAAGKNEIVFY